ncbi:MAG: SDR family oxidoreductase [Gammaproteobacteria bacterium]|nr:SDR family oxidoreductase [Gammaproteobacteria bacterium]
MGTELKGKAIVVTGGGSGIGRETALAMAAEGALLAIADINLEAAEETVALIESKGGFAMAGKCDVSKSAPVDAFFDSVIDAYGRVDCAFNNAGIEGVYGRTSEYTDADWQNVLDVNLTGVFHCLRKECQLMLKQPTGGSIVNTASIVGLIGWRGAPAYVATKHAVVGLTKTVALEYAKQGIRVNAVCPGVVETPMGERLFAETPGAKERLVSKHPTGRLVQAAEVAKAVIWLCLDRSSFTTGHALTVDGGFVVQ